MEGGKKSKNHRAIVSGKSQKSVIHAEITFAPIKETIFFKTVLYPFSQKTKQSNINNVGKAFYHHYLQTM